MTLDDDWNDPSIGYRIISKECNQCPLCERFLSTWFFGFFTEDSYLKTELE
jgi:hypothetical protein